MLDDRMRILACIIVVFGFAMIIRLIKQRKVDIKYSLVWFGAGIMIVIFALFPHVMDCLSKIIGIHSPINMLFFFALLIMASIVMSLTIVISGMSSKIRKLIQEVAILKIEIERLKK